MTTAGATDREQVLCVVSHLYKIFSSCRHTEEGAQLVGMMLLQDGNPLPGTVGAVSMRNKFLFG